MSSERQQLLPLTRLRLTQQSLILVAKLGKAAEALRKIVEETGGEECTTSGAYLTIDVVRSGAHHTELNHVVVALVHEEHKGHTLAICHVDQLGVNGGVDVATVTRVSQVQLTGVLHQLRLHVDQNHGEAPAGDDVGAGFQGLDDGVEIFSGKHGHDRLLRSLFRRAGIASSQLLYSCNLN
jgi:hypothetical protein